jgi:hypothetical protein
MDKAVASGAADAGSIPAWDANWALSEPSGGAFYFIDDSRRLRNGSSFIFLIFVSSHTNQLTGN